jgi:preprotein translocase subunit SecB
VKLPQATSDTWQAQMHIASDISTQAGTNYDFSVVLNSSTDHPHVMVKLVSTTDDGVYYCADAVKLKAFEDYVYYFSDVPGQDIAALKLVLDFGGNAAGTVVTASNIVLKRHADDDGTVLPSAEPEAAVSWVDENSVDNMWHGVTFSTFFYYAPGWSQIADPGFDVDGSKYTITLPSATSDQWQAQVHLNTDLTTSSAENYDFRITLNSTKDIKGATVKLVQDGKDDLYYFAERINLTAYDDITYKCVNMPGIDMTKVKLVLDFGGNPADAVVTASGIILQKHRE